MGSQAHGVGRIHAIARFPCGDRLLLADVCVEIVANGAEVCPMFGRFVRSLAGSGQKWPSRAEYLARLGHFCPDRADFGLISTEWGAERGPSSAKVRSDFADIEPTSVQVTQLCPELDRFCPDFGNIWLGFGEHWPNSGEFRPNAHELCRFPTQELAVDARKSESPLHATPCAPSQEGFFLANLVVPVLLTTQDSARQPHGGHRPPSHDGRAEGRGGACPGSSSRLMACCAGAVRTGHGRAHLRDLGVHPQCSFGVAFYSSIARTCRCRGLWQGRRRGCQGRRRLRSGPPLWAVFLPSFATRGPSPRAHAPARATRRERRSGRIDTTRCAHIAPTLVHEVPDLCQGAACSSKPHRYPMKARLGICVSLITRNYGPEGGQQWHSELHLVAPFRPDRFWHNSKA